MRAWFVGLVVGWAGPAWAVPMTLTQQGRLLDAHGDPLPSVSALQFSLYDAATGGTAVWTETHTPTLDGGYYTVQLGTTATLDAGDLAGARWLAISVDGTPLGARLPLDSVPYAILSQRAERADAATTADSATTAGHAATADAATTAGHATTADSATTAGHAATADSATAAGHAATADAATTAVHATTADAATTAGHATTADDAARAAQADVATEAGTLTPGAALDVASLSIDGQSVIAADGSISWDQITGAPLGLHDLGCDDGQLAGYDNGWDCVDPGVGEITAGAGLTGGTITTTGTVSVAAGGIVPSMLAADKAALSRISSGTVTLPASGGLRIGNTIYGAWSAQVPFTFNGAGYATGKLQIKTALTCGNGQGHTYMWHIEFTGHDYAGATPFRTVSVGYSETSYPAEIQDLGTVVDYGSLSVVPYCSTDDFLSFELDLTRGGAVKWHASDLTVNLLHGASSYQRYASDRFAVTAAREGSRY